MPKLLGEKYDEKCDIYVASKYLSTNYLLIEPQWGNLEDIILTN